MRVCEHADESVVATIDTIEVTGPDVMKQAARALAEGTGLSARTVAGLGRGELEEPL